MEAMLAKQRRLSERRVPSDRLSPLSPEKIGMIGIGMNSMGSHYNPVSFNIVNSESSEALKSSYNHYYNASVTGMYKLFKEVKLCDKEPCDFCRSIEEPTSKGSKMTKTLKTKNATNNFFHIDKPSSDNSGAFYSFAKKKFGSTTRVQQCGKHLSGSLFSKLIEIYRN